MKRDNILSLLGLAAKSGSVVSGEFSTEKAVKSKKAYLVIVANDASENTRKMFRDMTTYHGVPMYLYGEKEVLGYSIGKGNRASLAVINEGFARSIADKLKNIDTTE